MPDFDPQLALAVLRANPQTLGLKPQERDAYIQQAAARLGGRSPEDRREAAKLVVETAKMFLTIGVGVLVATFAWMQSARTNGVPWLSLTLVPFYVASILLVCSMVSGFLVISRIYKRADGREAPTEPAWSTLPIVGRLNVSPSQRCRGPACAARSRTSRPFWTSARPSMARVISDQLSRIPGPVPRLANRVTNEAAL